MDQDLKLLSLGRENQNGYTNDRPNERYQISACHCVQLIALMEIGAAAGHGICLFSDDFSGEIDNIAGPADTYGKK